MLLYYGSKQKQVHENGTDKSIKDEIKSHENSEANCNSKNFALEKLKKYREHFHTTMVTVQILYLCQFFGNE